MSSKNTISHLFSGMNRIKKIVNRLTFIVLLVVLNFAQVHAKTFYISKAGNDQSGTGTNESPWFSIEHAIQSKHLSSGDLIQLGEGVFVLDHPITLPQGVSLRGKKQNTVITGTCFFQLADTDFHHHSEKFLIQVPYAVDQTFSDFVLDGQSRQIHGGLFIGKAERILVSNIEVRDFNWCGIWLVNSQQSEISYCNLLNNAYQHTNNCTGNLQIWSSADLKLNHIYIKETRWAYAIKTYTTNWTKKEWWEAPIGRIVNLEISDCYLDVPELGGWVVPGTTIHAPDIAIELQGVDLLGVNIHHNWMNNHISAVLKRWGTVGQSLHIHHNIFDIHPWGYSIELNQDYAEIDHNLFFGGQHPFAQWEGGRTNRKLHIHHNYIANLNTDAHFNAVMRWVGKTDSLSFNNNTIVYIQPPKNPLFFSEKEQGFSHSSFQNNLFINLSDTIGTPVFYSGIKGQVSSNNYANGFTDLKSNFSKDDLIQEQVSGYQVWAGKKGSPLDETGKILGNPYIGKMPSIGALEFSGKTCSIGPDSIWKSNVLSRYASASKVEKSLSSYSPNLSVNDVFKDLVENINPPIILDTLQTIEMEDGIEVRKIHFQSVVDRDRVNKLYAILINPKGKTSLPALLILHGGTQTADNYYDLGIQYARKGYACLIPDLPGIASPEWAQRDGNGSLGKWTLYPYGAKHFEVNPSVLSSSIFEGVTAAIQAFYLLKSLKFIDSNKIGIRGLSWGGYATTITTALLKKQVKAGFAVFGCGFYDLPSFFKPILDNMETEARQEWLAALDAGRYADRITAPFYFMAASNDTYFHPTAVMATYDRIKGSKNILFSPNNDHNLSNQVSASSTEFAFFDYYLRRKGTPLPIIKLNTKPKHTDNSSIIEFSVSGDAPVKEAMVWYSDTNNDWMHRIWKPLIPVRINNNQFRFSLPVDSIRNNVNWYITVTDDRLVSNGTRIYPYTVE